MLLNIERQQCRFAHDFCGFLGKKYRGKNNGVSENFKVFFWS